MKKSLLFSAALLMVVPSAVFAQDEAAAPAPAEAAAEAGLSTETPIATLMANEEAAAVVKAHFPDLAAHPMYESFKAMSLSQLAPMSQGAITPEMLAATDADLAAIGAD